MSAKVFQMDLWDVMPSPSEVFGDLDSVCAADSQCAPDFSAHDECDDVPSPSEVFGDGDDVEGFFFDEDFIRAWYRAHGEVLNPSRDVFDGDWFPIFGDPCRLCPLREACSSDGCALTDVPLLCNEPEPFSYDDYSQVDF